MRGSSPSNLGEPSRSQASRAKAAAPNSLTLNLTFGSADGIGGSERRMIEVVTHLTSLGVNVRALAPGPFGTALNLAMAAAGASVHTYPNPVSLTRLASRCTADATWCFGARASFPLLAARLSPGWHAGDLWVAKNGLEALRSRSVIALESVLIQSADLVIANSRAAAQRAVGATRVRPERVHYLPSALPAEWTVMPLRPPRADVRIAMIGNARPEKRHALGLRLFAELDDPRTSLTIFTNDGSRVRADLLALPRETASRISILEGITITPKLMRDIDLLLHPSSSESMPRVALEARAQGAWVVGFDVGDLALYSNAKVLWGDEAGLLDAMSSACASVHSGSWPPPIQIISVAAYSDAVVDLLAQTQAARRQGTRHE